MSSSTSNSRSLRSLRLCLYSLGLATAMATLWQNTVGKILPADVRLCAHVQGELYWDEEAALPYSAPRDPRTVDRIVIGNSRVNHAIHDARLEEAGLGTTTIYWGQGGQLLDLLDLLEGYEPRDLVVALDATSIYSEAHPEAVRVFRLQMEERSTRSLTTRIIDKRLNGWLNSQRNHLIATVDTEPWSEAWLETYKPKAAGHIRKRLRPMTRQIRLKRLNLLGKRLQEMRHAGWVISAVRLPVHPRVRRVEDEALAPELFSQLCSATGIPYLDYSRKSYGCYDGHHMRHEEAARFSDQLAADLVDLENGKRRRVERNAKGYK